jgi:hypothetical protein
MKVPKAKPIVSSANVPPCNGAGAAFGSAAAEAAFAMRILLIIERGAAARLPARCFAFGANMAKIDCYVNIFLCNDG